MQRNAIYALLLTVVGLTVLGIVMLFSTSAFAQESHGDIYFFVKRQAFWLTISIFCALIGALVDYHWWKKIWWVVFLISIILLILCFVQPIGLKINGSRRWIQLGFGTFQPSELAKVAVVLFTAWWFEKFEKESGTFFKGFVFPMAVVCIVLFPISRQEDLGYTALIGAAALCVMFVGGMRLRWILPIVIVGLAGILYLAIHINERRDRLLAFLNPEEYQASGGYQQLQGLIAIGSGGVDGLGLGEGRQKMLYLP
ncbi:MAG TPA: FtsW/RodA/SpoVE family cell cycle protein, partial [Terrimicrobiaceae bacterium]|nr:FtsW/RodA/SpoVE family cell cycle protein [Terrimicrobiaceae bacterium]